MNPEEPNKVEPTKPEVPNTSAQVPTQPNTPEPVHTQPSAPILEPTTNTPPIAPGNAPEPTTLNAQQPQANQAGTQAKKPKSKKLLIIIIAVVLVIIIVVVGFLLFMPKSGTSNKADPTAQAPQLKSEESKTTQTQVTTTNTTSNFTTTTTETGVPSQETVNNDVLSQIAAIETKSGNKVGAKDVAIKSKTLASSTGNVLVEQWNVTISGKPAVYTVTINIDGGKQTFKVEKKN